MSEADCSNNLNSIIPFSQEVEGTEWASDSPEVTQSQDWKPHNLTCLVAPTPHPPPRAQALTLT